MNPFQMNSRHEFIPVTGGLQPAVSWWLAAAPFFYGSLHVMPRRLTIKEITNRRTFSQSIEVSVWNFWFTQIHPSAWQDVKYGVFNCSATLLHDIMRCLQPCESDTLNGMSSHILDILISDNPFLCVQWLTCFEPILEWGAGRGVFVFLRMKTFHEPKV